MAMKIDRLHQVAGSYDSLAESREFYTMILGATCIAEFDPPGLLFIELSGTRLLLERGGSKATLYFWVSDIDQAHQELSAKGVVFTSEPHQIFDDTAGVFGKAGEAEWMAFFSDPGGNTLAIASRQIAASKN